METISIIDSKDYVDQKVKIGVWLTNKRSSGKIAFCSFVTERLIFKESL